MKHNAKKFLTFLIGFAAAVTLTGCGGNLENLAESMLYPFAQVNKKFPVPEIAPEGYKSIFLEAPSSDGGSLRVNSWVYRHPSPSTNRVYVYFHGNGENLQALFQYQFLEKMKELNSHFVVMDYPGLGQSIGRPNEANLVNSALVTIDWAQATFPNHTLIVWGRSLGASVATIASEKRQEVVDGLVLTSPWLTFIEMARAITKLVDQVPSSWLDQNKYDSGKAAENIELTTMIHHGNKDTLIPFRFGKALSERFPDPSNVLINELEGLGHNDIFTSQELWQDIRNFIR